MNDQEIDIITETNYKDVLLVLWNKKQFPKKLNKRQKNDVKTVKKYFKDRWKGYGVYSTKHDFINDIDINDKLLAYCFIKYPDIHPETMTVVRTEHRNKSLATKLRNYVLEQREFVGHVVHSAVKLDNPASFKSLLKSGYTVFDVTEDGYVQLVKVLEYH